jgi:hypothetical protein
VIFDIVLLTLVILLFGIMRVANSYRKDDIADLKRNLRGLENAEKAAELVDVLNKQSDYKDYRWCSRSNLFTPYGEEGYFGYSIKDAEILVNAYLAEEHKQCKGTKK